MCQLVKHSFALEIGWFVSKYFVVTLRKIFFLPVDKPLPKVFAVWQLVMLLRRRYDMIVLRKTETSL
jgi:hypothetical protein